MNDRCAVRRCLIAFLLLVLAAVTAAQTGPMPAAGELAYEVAAELSQTEYAGRMTGTPGYLAAARYVAGRCEALGIPAGLSDGGYLQEFNSPALPSLVPISLQKLAAGGKQAKKYLFGRDFQGTYQRFAGVIAGDLVFAGYGITDPASGYDDYAGLDVSGRLVLVLLGGPDFLARGRDLDTKFRNAQQHGAAAFIALNPPGAAAARINLSVNITASRMPFLLIEPGVGQEWLAAAGLDARDLVEAIWTNHRPASCCLPVKLRLAALTAGVWPATGHNVIGVIPGRNGTAGPHLMLCAHLDHLGRDPDGMVYCGASDNASGVGVILEAASRLTAAGHRPELPIIVAAFGGEEMMGFGSRAYLENPVLPLAQLAAVINVDVMGGRLDLVGEVDSAHSLLRTVMQQASAAGEGLVRVTGLDPEHGSDHLIFDEEGIPAMMLCNLGGIDLIHTPDDTMEDVYQETLAAAVEYVVDLVERLACAVAEEEAA